MNNIVRAWKDETYRQSLSAKEQAMLPTNPAGEIELTEADLEAISGGICDFRNPHSQTEDNRAATTQKAAFATNGPITITPPPSLVTLNLVPTVTQTGNTCSDDFNPATSVGAWDNTD